MLDPASTWFARRTYHQDWQTTELLALKDASRLTVSVVLPAQNEAATVGEVVSTIRTELVDRHPLVDEIVVIDSFSADDTAAAAEAAGARVVTCDEILPELPARPGKGEALWRSLFVTRGDVLVFIDADLIDAGAHYITRLLGPILTDPEVMYVKGFYDRPLVMEDGVSSSGGGRVTELVARPLLNLCWPDLAGFAQPLAGEYAGRREALERVPFVTGYGVELALLLDLQALVGLDAMAQVDLGRRVHRNRPDVQLGGMAAEILATAIGRLDRTVPAVGFLTQFRREGRELVPHDVPIGAWERPPAASIPHYAELQSLLAEPRPACLSERPGPEC